MIHVERVSFDARVCGDEETQVTAGHQGYAMRDFESAIGVIYRRGFWNISHIICRGSQSSIRSDVSLEAGAKKVARQAKVTNAMIFYGRTNWDQAVDDRATSALLNLCKGRMYYSENDNGVACGAYPTDWRWSEKIKFAPDLTWISELNDPGIDQAAQDHGDEKLSRWMATIGMIFLNEGRPFPDRWSQWRTAEKNMAGITSDRRHA